MDFFFEYNKKQLKLGDMTLIENVFNDKQNPTVFVKKMEDLNDLIKKDNVIKHTDIDFII